MNDAPAVSISFVESRGEVVVSAGDAFGGPGEEIRFNYGEKPSQYPRPTPPNAAWERPPVTLVMRLATT